MAAPQAIIDLVARYARNEDAYRAPGYNETQLRREFLDPFFSNLGWDVDNKAGYAEQYKDVVHEDQIRIAGYAHAPDYSFRIGGQRKFFLEAKKPSVNIHDDPDPAFQLRRYAWSAKLPLSILSDFEEFAVYDCRIKPNQMDKASVARVMYWTWEQYAERWDEIAAIFSKDALLRGSFDRYADDNRAKRGTAEVDKTFLGEIESWRDLLARNIALRNQDLTTRELNFAVQRTIDRIIFLRICEARGIEDDGMLRELASGPHVYERLITAFLRADARYNSGIFHFKSERGRPEGPDELTPKLVVDDKPLREVVRSLYYPASPYEFSVLPADILGQVYEQFLGKVIRLTAGHQAKVEDKPEVRKAGGVYYTPSYVVDYIVKHTVDQLLMRKAPKGVSKLRVLDPACGSGSFLIVAYQHLLDWHRDWYVNDGPAKHTRELYQGPGGEWRLSTAERKRILTNNIFGVDIDPQAVEVTKLSLALKVLEGETRDTIGKTLSMFTERALPDLDGNIRCGNSLVGRGFYDAQPRHLFLAQEDRERINVFDWCVAFPDVMATGGFDAVIGNPPYVYRNATGGELRTYFQTHYRSAEGNFELYKFFLEKAIALSKERTGRVGMIVSATFLVQGTFERLRTILLGDCILHTIAPLGPGVFDGATVDTAVIVLTRGQPAASHQVAIIAPPSPRELNSTAISEVRQQRFQLNPKRVIDYRLTDDGARLVERLCQTFATLETHFEIGVGINTGFIKDELVAESQLDERYHPMVPGNGIARYGKIKTSGWIMYDRGFVRSRGSRGRTLPEERFFDQPKILVVRTRNLSLPVRIVATLDETRGYNLNRLTNIIARDGGNLLGLLGMLNSQLYQWLFSTRFYDYEIKPVYLRDCPIAETSDPTLIELVRSRLGATSERRNVSGTGDGGVHDAHIAALERALNDCVFALYGLSDYERELILGETADGRAR